MNLLFEADAIFYNLNCFLLSIAKNLNLVLNFKIKDVIENKIAESLWSY